ncbi:MAG: DUF4424 family protein [Pseudomonadota bacterium]
MLLCLSVGPTAAELDAPYPPEWLTVPAGGLRLPLANQPVLIESQDLRLSPEAVEVTYRLANGGESDLALTVGFPFPNQPADSAPGLAAAFLDAHLDVEGVAQPVAAVGRRLYNDGRDVTDALFAAGIDLDGLPDGALQRLSRSEHHRFSRALSEQGLEQPARHRWSLAIEPRWQVLLPARSTTSLRLSYRPHSGHSTDRFTERLRIRELTHLEAYCAEDQPPLLEWLQARISEGLEAADADFVDIGRLELSYLWEDLPAEQRERRIRVEVRVADDTHLAFCFPGGVARLPDGTHLAGMRGVPEEQRLDVVILE